MPNTATRLVRLRLRVDKHKQEHVDFDEHVAFFLHKFAPSQAKSVLVVAGRNKSDVPHSNGSGRHNAPVEIKHRRCGAKWVTVHNVVTHSTDVRITKSTTTTRRLCGETAI